MATLGYDGTLSLHHAVDADGEYDDLRVEARVEWKEEPGNSEATSQMGSMTRQQSAGATDHGAAGV